MNSQRSLWALVGLSALTASAQYVIQGTLAVGGVPSDFSVTFLRVDAALRYLRALDAGQNATPDEGQLSAQDVRELREAAAWAQATLADLLGVLPQTVSNWETGRYAMCTASARHVELLALQHGIERRGGRWVRISRHEDNVTEGDCR